ncbi:MAG: lipid-binding SYLF domain-containing protein [Alphaproteobacteria bacterium]|nr:lipid-binding SYLF domain-containing protein [Alphaproteobacteria bacterium]
MRTMLLAVATSLALVLLGHVSWGQTSDQTALLDNAVATVHHMRHDETFGPSRDLLRRARAVLIVPGLVKGGFLFGAEGGNGVLLERHGNGWSQPAFYTLASGSFGLQIGLEKAQLVMFLMSDRALRALERSKFKFGGGAGLTVITVGANAQGASGPDLSGDIIVWSSTQGAYGGLTLEGSVVAPKRGWNDRFYGRETDVRDILADHVHSAATSEMRDALAEAEDGDRYGDEGMRRHHDNGARDSGGPPRDINGSAPDDSAPPSDNGNPPHH